MIRVLIAVAALFVLGACASSRYEPAYGAGGGYYFIGDSAPTARYYHVPRVPLHSYGISPWWGYTYYSPYFYPHHFYVWYAPWPYYDAWPDYTPWPYYSSLPPGYRGAYPPYPHHPVNFPGDDPGEGRSGAPLPGHPGASGGAVVVDAERWRLVDERTLRREMRYVGPPTGSSRSANAARGYPAPASYRAPTAAPQRSLGPGAATTPGSVRMPSAAAAGSRPVTGSRSYPGRVSRSNPALHDQ